MMHDNYLKKVYVGAVVFFAAIITLVLVIFLVIIPVIKDAGRLAFLDVLVAPVDATVMINGEEYRNAVYEMEPGHYTATVAKDGFKTVTAEFDLGKDKTAGLYLYLEPSDGNWNYYEQAKNQASLEALLRLNNYNSDGAAWWPPVQVIQEKDAAKKLAERYKVKSILPVNVSLCGDVATRMTCNAIKVEYKYSKKCNDSLCLVISGRSRELPAEALSEIREKFATGGFSFDDYQYVYVQNTEL